MGSFDGRTLYFGVVQDRLKIQNNILNFISLKSSHGSCCMPIIVIFFKENGLSLTQIMILQSVYSLTVALTEIYQVISLISLEEKINNYFYNISFVDI